MKIYPTLLMLPLLLVLSFAACGQVSEKATKTYVNPSGQKQQPGMQYVLHKAGTRGETNAGWLKAKHSFSFNNYYDPDRMNFGALRVLNDDIIDPNRAFPMHPHQNMEIISIVLEGAMAHKDNMGKEGLITANDVQIMSAGTGVRHAEANPSKTDTLKSLQIWVLPNRQNVQPRYEQHSNVLKNQPQNSFRTLISPTDTNAIFLHQDAVFTMAKLAKGKKKDYEIQFDGNGVYAFLIEGSAEVNGVPVERRDAIGVWDTDKLSIKANENTRMLLMEVPMLE